MIVTFKCKSAADVVMFGSIAQEMLKLMGHSGTIPGAILAEDVGTALDNLVKAVEKSKNQPVNLDAEEDNEQEDSELPVGLPQRALPLIELLRAAVKDKTNVMWDK